MAPSTPRKRTPTSDSEIDTSDVDTPKPRLRASSRSAARPHVPKLKGITPTVATAVAILSPTFPPPTAASISEGVLQSTRDLTESNRKLAGPLQLRAVIPCPLDFLDSTFKEVESLVRNLQLDPKNHDDRDFLHLIHPNITSLDRPIRIYSEKDSEDWILHVLLIPVLRLITALQHGTFPKHSRKEFPNFTSAPAGRVGESIPDFILWQAFGVPANILEVKT
ncbi:hypothetical protein C8R47DRAFT_1216736 [Mycena vitilis]|nr:hypothetical protein C8R47DRAFT_1216736 [Mycena vitilis]